MGTSKKYGMNTKAIHTKKRVELPTGDVMPPIHLSTTFENTQPGEYEYFYGRSGNPTRELFERTMHLSKVWKILNLCTHLEWPQEWQL